MDQDGIELKKTSKRLSALVEGLVGHPAPHQQLVQCCHENFGNLLNFTQVYGVTGQVSAVLVDLGYSSMQIDDPSRGFTYKHQGPLDMRMNTAVVGVADDVPRASSSKLNSVTESRCVTAYEFLCGLKHPRQLSDILQINSDFEAEHAWVIASSLLDPQRGVPSTTFDFAERIRSSYSSVHRRTNSGEHLSKKDLDSVVARCFQAVRIEVNAEFKVLDQLLAALPHVLIPGGKAVVLTFHSGEDRRVKKAFKAGFNSGVYRSWSRDVVTATLEEKRGNSRSKCCKLRWVVKD